MWICSKCKARVEPSFDVCWRCGTTAQGVEDPDFLTADETPPISEPTDYLKLDPGKLPESELPEAPLELVACFASHSLVEAQFVANELVAEGIPATLQNTNRAKRALGPCVVVRAEDLPGQYRSAMPARARRPWRLIRSSVIGRVWLIK